MPYVEKSGFVENEYSVICEKCGKTIIPVYQPTLRKAKNFAEKLISAMGMTKCPKCGADLDG